MFFYAVIGECGTVGDVEVNYASVRNFYRDWARLHVEDALSVNVECDKEYLEWSRHHRPRSQVLASISICTEDNSSLADPRQLEMKSCMHVNIRHILPILRPKNYVR
jgi:hypothetical protein